MDIIAQATNGYLALNGFRRVAIAQAACTGSSGDLFFSPLDTDAHSAKEICQGCSVRWECLAYALDTEQRHGVWGGLTADERRVLSRKVSQGMTA